MRQCKDSRALPTLLTTLTKSEETTSCCIAADAIGEIGDSAVEMRLIQALVQCKDRRTEAAVCGALAKIGTARSLPELRKLAADTDHQGAINIAGAARSGEGGRDARASVAAFGR